MSSISSVKSFSVDMSKTLQQATQQVMNDVQRKAERLTSTKENIAMAGLEQLQKKNQISAMQSEQQNRIDVYV
ncbi:hypothetical protein SAMN05660284_02442 [Formivibrio citricus]|uniref:Motility protein n=1 Tax=Formivibrio citricus TaxID=83765 RepID=A0A1I5CMN6_9NEIS|nr:hypothetical protein [Formivibrio citricus]SFN88184.1 hypothetical protein SAMN05660284_02442 [Formivibrio citricus]